MDIKSQGEKRYASKRKEKDLRLTRKNVSIVLLHEADVDNAGVPIDKMPSMSKTYPGHKYMRMESDWYIDQDRVSRPGRRTRRTNDLIQTVNSN
jgi:hypothetical protein